VKRDIEVAAEALNGATKGRIQVVMGISDLQLKQRYGMTRQEALERSAEMVAYARTFTYDVEFAAEDATRSDTSYLMDVAQLCARAGAHTIKLPDTVGHATPLDYFDRVSVIVNCLPAHIVVSTHCHNDLGLAVANTLAGVQAGARQVDVTCNGLGERVGNAASEAVIMALTARRDLYGVKMEGIHTREIMNTSRLVAELSGMPVAHDKPVVGRNAFLHESGIPQDGMSKSPQTYRLMDPTDIGLDGYRFRVSKLSDKRVLEQRLRDLCLCNNEQTIEAFTAYFKDHTAKKKFITDDDIVGLYERFNR
jgi:2-isopropylmalate synthase